MHPVLFSFSVSAAGYELVAKKAECNGAAHGIWNSPSLAACAESCSGKASMFAYGTNEFGDNRCSSDGTCRCLCEYASANGVCTKQIEHTGYNLYKYKSGMFISLLLIHDYTCDPSFLCKTSEVL